LVCRQGQLDESLLPDNIILKTDIPMNEALHVMNNAYVNVVPILDASTGAGHMTIVSSMHMGQLQIISSLETLSDYFIDREHGLFVEAGNVGDLKNAIELLFNDEELRNNMSIKVVNFSAKWLSEDYAKESFLSYLCAIKHNNPLPLEPADWNLILKELNIDT